MSRAPARPSRIAAALFLVTGFALSTAAGCHDGRDAQAPQPPPPCQPGACPPGQWPSLPAPAPDPSPTALPPAGLMPAFVGFPCQTTEDLICGWGKCMTGRCGGCQSNNDCKPGAACGWTPIGMTCLYAGSTAQR